MTATRIAITGMGAATPIGLTAVQTCAAQRAGIDRFADHPYAYSLLAERSTSDPEPLVCSPVPFLDPLAAASDRLLNLALAPLEEAFTTARMQRSDLGRTRLFLATSPVVEGVPEWGLEQHLPGELLRRASLPAATPCTLFRQGQTGFHHALEAAHRAFVERECDFALVGAVDTYLDQPTVEHFDHTYRLKSERNLDGFVPGEGSVVLVAERPEDARARGASILGEVHAIAFGTEAHDYHSDELPTGRGLSNMLRQLVEQTQCTPAWVVCDLNGESYRAHEWGLALTQLGARMEPLEHFDHPVDCTGDLRTVNPALDLLIACRALSRGYAPAEECLLFASDDRGERSGCVVRATEGEVP